MQGVVYNIHILYFQYFHLHLLMLLVFGKNLVFFHLLLQFLQNLNSQAHLHLNFCMLFYMHSVAPIQAYFLLLLQLLQQLFASYFLLINFLQHLRHMLFHLFLQLYHLLTLHLPICYFHLILLYHFVLHNYTILRHLYYIQSNFLFQYCILLAPQYYLMQVHWVCVIRHNLCFVEIQHLLFRCFYQLLFLYFSLVYRFHLVRHNLKHFHFHLHKNLFHQLLFFLLLLHLLIYH